MWLGLTATALLSTAWALRRGVASARSDAAGAGRLRQSRATVALLGLFLATYVAVNLVGEDFTGYDDSQFTLYSLRGADYPAPIWRDSGRFFPLGLQEFNIAGRVTRSAAGYHAVPMLEMLMLVSILLMLDERLSVPARAALAAIALLLPSVVLSFGWLIYTECDVLFWLTSMAFCVERLSRTGIMWWGVGAVLCAQFALYYKEPVFLLVLTFATVRIWLRARHCGSMRKALREREARLDIALAAVSLAFAVFYAVVILSGSRLGYLVDTRTSPLQAARAYFRMDLLVWVFAVFTVIRMYRVVRGRYAPELLWDGLACGGLAYFAAYLAMGMASEYYLAPVDLIAVLYLGRSLYLSLAGMRTPMRAVSAILAAVVLVQSLHFSILRVVERKFVIERKASIASIIVGMKARDPGRGMRLYFPFTSPYGIAEFAAYLGYRGVPVEETGQASSERGSVELYTGAFRDTGRCVPIRNFVCHASTGSEEAMAVVFPDDTFPPSGLKLHHELEEKLLALDPLSRGRRLFIRSLEFFWTCANFI